MTEIDFDQLNSLDDVERLAAEYGLTFNKADYERIQQVREIEKKRLLKERAEASEGSTWADQFNYWYPKLLQAIASFGNILLTVSQAIIVNLGVPIVLILLLIVEQQRVYHGIELFEFDQGLAAFGAWSIVVLNLLLEFQVHHIEHKKGYEAALDKRWSLRIWWANMQYRLGRGAQWTEQLLSPAERYRRLLGIVTFTILALALAGSMRAVIEAQPGTWYEALAAILLKSSLLDMMTWLGGLLFAAAAVLSAQGLSRYVAIRTVEIMDAMSGDDSDLAEQLDQSTARAAYAVLKAKLDKKKKPLNPIQPPLLKGMDLAESRNGNGQYHHQN